MGAPEIPVTEFVYTTRRAQRGLLNYFYNHRSQGESIRWNEGLHDTGYRFVPDGKTGHTTMPYMMARIVDVETALTTVPVNPEAVMMPITLNIKVTDTLCDWNNGVFALSLGESTLPNVKRVSAESVDEIDITIDIGGLTVLLMGAVSAKDLVFEGKLQGESHLD